jgi:itaconate CoA-transferase
MQIDAIAAKLTATTAPDGRRVRLPPMAVDQAGVRRDYAFPPRYGEQSEMVLREVGYGDAEIARLREKGILAGPDAVKAREISPQQ